MTALISSSDLNNKLNTHNLAILDASWHMPSEKRDAKAEYQTAHIPGALFFDIDAISDATSSYPHMLPSPENFASSISALGIENDDHVVIYDANGLFSAPRVWWMFRIFGHSNVQVLDGGLLKWKAENRALESGISASRPSHFNAMFYPQLLRSYSQIAANINHPNEILLDARSPGRFSGSEPEPRSGLKSGYIGGSINIHYKECLSPPYNTLKSPSELRSLFASRHVNTSQPLAATCGSGITACILALALFELGNENVAIYDGAWSEWGSQVA